MDFRRFLVFTGLVVGALAGTIKEKQCSKACDSLDDEGMFRAFKSYYFSYALDIDSRVNGRDSAQSSTVRIEATAVIEGISACDKILKLSDINILEKRQDGIMVAPEAGSSFRDTLSAHPLRFSMKSNGTITSVCPEAGEEIWALNVKRGFLSHIQTRGITRLHVFEESGVFETGVTGVCMPVYRRTGELTFIKRNDYLNCKHRTNLNLFGDAIPLPPQGPPVSPLASRMECEYEMDSQTIRSIECRELHTVKPFSESESIPETMVHSVIRRIDVRPTIKSALGRRFARRTSLLYEDPVQVSRITSNDVRNTITHICESITDGITSETPLLFETLTKQLGELDIDHINDVVNGLQGICSPGETHEMLKMVKDALIDCDKEQCALGFHSLVQSENSPENEVYLRKWFMKLVFHKNPTKNMINLVKHYVRGSREVNLPGYYALSSMIHQYCRMSEEDCSSDRDILNAAVIFEDNLHESCLPENEEDKKKILMSLRAIGNMGLIQSKNLLERCHRGENSNQIHVAAIRAYRMSSCYAVPIGRFIRIFSNIDNDSELRIAAYRAIIRCPSFELLKSIANILSIELNDQVSCYVSSHLANLENSPDLMLADLQTAISQSPLANITKCAMDFKKFSNNYGFSYSDDESGNGIHFDSDVIFTAKSYLPRSARLAMNIDLFGHSLNLFELDARIEGWEALEALMTPGEKDREANMIQKLKWKMSKLVGNVLNKMNTKYGSSRDLVGDVSEEATVAMKFLGNDVFYGDQNDFKSVVEMFSREKIMKKISSLATQRTGEYSHNKILKSSKVTVPTLTGMPLEVSIQGAINTVWKASSKLDVMGMMTTPRRMAIQGLFEPSAAIEIHSDMMVDVHCARSGLTHRTNLASSLSFGGSLSFTNGMFKVKINAPRRRETIINASSALYFMQRNEMVLLSEPEDAVITHEQTLSNPRYNLRISGRRPMLISLPEAFLHTWTMKVMLDKLEEGLVSYDFEAGLRTDTMFRTGETDHMHLLVGAPGSETIGVYSVDVVYHRRNKTLIVRTERPGESAFYMGSLRNEPNSKRLHLLRTVSRETFRLEIGMDKILLTNGVKFVPVFVHYCPHFNVTLDGYVTYIGEKTTWNFTLVNHHIHIGRRDSVTEGNFIKNSTLELVTLTVRAHDLSIALEGGFRLEETPSSVVINPIFCYNLWFSDYDTKYYRADGGPVVIWKEGGVTLLNKLFLDLTRYGRSSNSTRRLMEVSKLQMSKSGFSFQGKLQDDRPFRVEVDIANNEQYSVNITTQTSRGENNLRGVLFNVSSEDIYRLEIEACDGTEEFKLTSEFKNEARALQYLETTMAHKGEQFYRRKTGLRTQILDTRTIRYTPIFIFEGFGRSMRTYMEGSVDVSESGFTINDLAFVDRRDIVRLSGSTLFGHDGKISSVTWSYDLDGTCMAEIGMYAGSISYHENMVSFQTSVASDPSLNQTDFSLTFDLQNSTQEGEIFAWDGKVEFVVPPHPELNFRMDTEYNLTPKRSSGNIFRLCYSSTDCALTEKLVTLGHDLTFSLDRRNGLYNHDLEVTYTHPAAEQEINVEWTTSCVPDDVSSGNSIAHLTLKHQVGNHFTTAITPIADEESSNCTSNFIVTAPGYYEYGFNDIFLVSDETFDLNPFDFRYGWLC